MRDGLGELATGASGRGANAQAGARLEVHKTLFERNRGLGVYAGEDGTSVELSDVVIRDTEPEDDGRNGGAINAEYGASVSAVRLVVARTREVALSSLNPGSTMTVADVTIRDTDVRQSDQVLGRALSIERGGHMEVTRAIIERAHEISVSAMLSAELILTDALIRDTLSTPDDDYGRGINVQDGSTGTFSRLVIAGVRDVGIAELDSMATVDDVVVENTMERACAETTCTANAFGYGLAASGGSMTVRGFAVRRSALCGVFLEVGQIDLARGEVSGSPIGACVQVPGYDLARLSNDVSYTDNGINLDSTTLPVPDIAQPESE